MDREETLTFSKFETPLGDMIAIGDETSLYFLGFQDGASWERMATIPGSTPPIQQVKTELHEYFQGRRREFETPLSPLGTPFQKTVWDHLRKIPFGQTRSYAALAQSIQKPTAFRAAAQANGANPIVILIPCHRVINSDGKLGGYSSGLQRKEWLLKHESR